MFLFLAACGPVVDPVDEELTLRLEILEAIHTEVVAVEYADFAVRSAALEAAALAFCGSPTDAGLTDVRDRWREARGPWKRMEIVGFGPVVDEPHRYGPLIDFWPVRDTVVDDLLAEETALDLDSVRGFGASTRGFPVLDYLLWHPELEGATTFANDPRRCTYIASLATDLRMNADDLHGAWLAYAPLLLEPAAQTDFAYLDTQDVVDEWVNRMLFALDNIRAEKLGKPLGDGSQGNPLPDAVESRYSARSLADARDVYAGVEIVFDGREMGFDDLMPPSRTPITFFDNMAVARDDARAALAAVPEPLEASITADPASVVAAQDALREVQVLIQVEMAQALNVALAFNDNDGD